jgi:hypothetical protein
MASCDPKDLLVKMLLQKEKARLENLKAWRNKKCREDPEWREKQREAARRRYQASKRDPDPVASAEPADPKVLAKREAARERYHNDPEFREKRKEAMRNYQAAKRAAENPGKRAGPGRPRQSEALVALVGTNLL